ncbi:hypothetical protein NTJ28_001801 [Flavobacterium psychrophilum]|nr:hypothetical protein [Flavobacterium psychrophilum]EKT4510656.1 hypothetical protein [Flavobacterium psychrophilum]
MKKIFLTTMMAFVTVLSVAQEIKIKKGKISLDGVEVALLEKKKLVYTISTLDNIPKFSVEMKNSNLLDGTTVYWCILTDLNTNKTNEILDKGSYEGLSFEKSIVSSVTQGQYKFITTSGIDEKLVADYINGPQSTITKDFEELNKKTVEDLKNERALLDKLKIKIVNGTIYQKQNATDKQGNPIEIDMEIGLIERREEVTIQGFAPSIFYTVSSIEKMIDQYGKNKVATKLIANWYKTRTGYDNPVTGKKIKEQIITADNKSFNLPEIQPEMSAIALNTTFGKPDEVKLKEAIVARLIFNGYVFGSMNTSK